MTYKNVTGAPIDIEIQTDGGAKHYIIGPGGLFTFDETADNGADIIGQLQTAGAVAV